MATTPTPAPAEKFDIALARGVELEVEFDGKKKVIMSPKSRDRLKVIKHNLDLLFEALERRIGKVKGYVIQLTIPKDWTLPKCLLSLPGVTVVHA